MLFLVSMTLNLVVKIQEFWAHWMLAPEAGSLDELMDPNVGPAEFDVLSGMVMTVSSLQGSVITTTNTCSQHGTFTNVRLWTETE